MGIPELPTDNLYKFMATFGFLIAVLSFGYLVVSLSGQGEMIARIEVASETHEEITTAERAPLERQIAALEETAQIVRTQTEAMLSDARENPALVSPDQIEEIERKSAEVTAQLERHTQEFETFTARAAERAAPLRQDLAVLRSQLELWRWLALFLFITGTVGSGLSIWGFRLWYEKVQVHQDAILAREATNPYPG